MSEEKDLQELRTRLREIKDLRAATSILYWDQATYMPPAGAKARAQQIGTLSRLTQEKLIDPALGKLLEDLASYESELPYDRDEASLIRITRREYERATKVPPQFVADFNAHSAESYGVWTRARPEDDFSKTFPYLQKTLDLSRQYADFFPGYDHIADPLIDESDYGMKAETVRQLFTQLRQGLVPLVQTITDQPPADDSCLYEIYPEEKQLAFGRQVIEDFGYDFNRGRQDKTPHPFMIGFSVNDVRITTRVKENKLDEALFGTLHESGHAMYELGINPAYEGTLLARGTSSGVHESQSRLWENQVGRSRAFWDHYFPKLQKTFPDQLGRVSLDDFYQAINKVQRSLIRTEADEVTYNLHVMIRFDLELDMLEGNLAVEDLPDAWHARYESDLGLRAPDDRDGVLQDMHWFSGFIGGAFQGYTLGNIMSAMFFDQAVRESPQIPEEIGRGEFGSLHGWLKENIYQHGRKFTAEELVQRVTGGPITIEPYMRYLRTKFGELYDL
ncbi:MAG: carboxypeptidase M32 [Chloroflexota bacterium]|jgi:carboxypeptidase Taq